MTTKKTQTKSAATSTKEPSEDLLAAYEIHTLAQMTYRYLAQVHPWALPFPGSNVFARPEAWPPDVMADPTTAWSAYRPYVP